MIKWSVTQEQLLNTAEDEVLQQGEKEIILHDGYDSNHNTNEGTPCEINMDNPSSWPINSKEARMARREFIMEGFRNRLNYTTPNNNGYAIDNNDYATGEEFANDSIIAMAVRELGWRFDQVDYSGDGNADSGDTIASTENDWMYLAQ